jgi:hypothetical protein
VDGKKYFVVLLNNSAHEVVFNIGFGDGTTSSKKIPAAGIAILTVPVEGKTKKTM